ncbi:MAG: hypothetical protein AMXMBFR48_26300 [Ignavibacteriales bacterium]
MITGIPAARSPNKKAGFKKVIYAYIVEILFGYTSSEEKKTVTMQKSGRE